jgi:hypothetical protein
VLGWSCRRCRKWGSERLQYVIRLLRICQRISLANIRDYFGFTDSEALALIESLSRQGLVSVQDEEVQLTSFANEKCDAAGDNRPTFTRIELMQDTITFDLQSFNPLRSFDKARRNNDNIIKLDAEEDVLGCSLERAKDSYRQKYHEIASTRKDLREKSYGIHSIKDIESKGRNYFPFNITFSLNANNYLTWEADDDFKRVASLDLDNLDALYKKIIASTSRADSVSNLVLEEFINIFDIQIMRSYLNEDAFDIGKYRNEVESNLRLNLFPEGVIPVLGNLYLPENRDVLVKNLTEQRHAKKNLTSLAWLAPDNDLWGRGHSFALTVSAISDLLRENGSSDKLYICSSADRGTEQSVFNRYRFDKWDEIHCFYPGSATNRLTLDGRLELMFYPNSFVAFLYHISISGNSPGLWTPVGFISKSSKHIDIAHDLLVQILEAGYSGPAKKAKTWHSAEKQPSYKDVFQFL